MGATLIARCICCALKFEIPMLRILPSALSFASSPTASSIDPGGTLRAAAPGRPVDLVEVDGINVQPLQTGLGFPSNRGCLQVVRDISGFVPDQAALSEDIRTRMEPLDSA